MPLKSNTYTLKLSANGAPLVILHYMLFHVRREDVHKLYVMYFKNYVFIEDPGTIYLFLFFYIQFLVLSSFLNRNIYTRC